MLADDAHRLDVEGDITRHGAIGFGPAQQATHRLQAAIDGGRLQSALCHHVLTPGDQIVLGQPGELRWRVVQAGVPGDELQQVVSIAARVAADRSSAASRSRNVCSHVGDAFIRGLVCIARHLDQQATRLRQRAVKRVALRFGIQAALRPR